MHSNVLHWSRGIIVFAVMMMWGIPGAIASTWSNYQDQAAAILNTTNQELNARVNPVASRTVKFDVEIFKSGEIKKVVVVESSGDPNLDATTVNWVMAVEELPPPSTSVYLGQIFESLTFTFDFAPIATAKGTSEQRAPAPFLSEPIAPPQPGEVKPEAPPATTPVPDQQVLKLQQGLIEKGYNPGPVDGFYGTKTARAIREFQADQGVNVNGRVSAQLITLLAKAAPQSTPRDVDPVVEPADPEAAEQDSGDVAEGTATATFSLDRELVEDYYYEEDKPVPVYDF